MTITPNILEETSRGIQSYAIEDMMLKNREIFLTSAINDQSAVDTIKQLMYLDHKSADPVTIYINSPGGSVTAGLAIYDTMNYIKCDVSTICVGMAASMGAFLLSSGAKGKRIALPNSEILIHQPLIGGNGLTGQATDIELAAKNLVRTKERLNEILAKNTGKSYEQIVQDTDRDNSMTAQEALAYGLVDKVIDKR